MPGDLFHEAAQCLEIFVVEVELPQTHHRLGVVEQRDIRSARHQKNSTVPCRLATPPMIAISRTWT